MLNKITETLHDIKIWAKGSGYDALIVWAQAHLETGGFTCELSKHNNYFGLFKTFAWLGDIYECITHEWEDVNGKTILVEHKTEYKAFSNPTQCFMEYDKYIQKKFPKAYKVRKSYRQFYTNLMTYVDLPNGEKKIVFPSFCTAVGYENACIRRYEELTKGVGGFELL